MTTTTSMPPRRPAKPRPWEQEAGGEPASFGIWLRRQREVREIGLREVANATKIGVRYLEALEQDEFDALPAPVFAKGFLREYARYIGLDPDEAVNHYLIAQQRLGAADEEATEASQPQPRRGWGRAAAVVVALVALAVCAYLAVRAGWLGGRPETPPPATESAPPAGSPSPAAAPGEAPPPAPGEPSSRASRSPATDPVARAAVDAPPAEAAPLVVTMDFSGDSWIEIQVDGERYINELHVQGESLRVEAQERVLVSTLGNARAVEIEVNGQPFSIPLAPEQTVARGVEITREMFAAPDSEVADPAGTKENE